MTATAENRNSLIFIGVEGSRDELIDILDDVVASVGEVLCSHLELTEALVDDGRVESTRRKVHALKTKLDQEKDALAKAKAASERKRALEKLKSIEESCPKQTFFHRFMDARGRLIGSVQRSGSDSRYMDDKNRTVARVHGGWTFDRKGVRVGRGDLGLYVLGLEHD